jgi:hypothetical protein
MVKVCPKCNTEKELSVDNFYTAVTRKDGFDNYCKICRRKQSSYSQSVNAETRKEYQSDYQRAHPTQVRAYQKKFRSRNRLAESFRSLKNKAKRRGMPFTISLKDIVVPDVCPILGIPIFRGEASPSDNSPSVDKVIPALGYVAGNIQVISSKANRMKSDGTLEEIVLLGEWAKKELSKCQTS